MYRPGRGHRGANLKRRHLNTSQQAVLGVEIEPHFAEEAKKRQGTRTDLKANVPTSETGRRPAVQARDQAAAAVGTSGKTLSAARSSQVRLSRARARVKQDKNLTAKRDNNGTRHEKGQHGESKHNVTWHGFRNRERPRIQI